MRMKLHLFTLLSLSLLSGCAKHMLPVPKDLPLAKYEQKVKPERVTLANGLTVFLIEDRELPVVSVTLTIRGGSLIDSEQRHYTLGLTSAMTDQMRQGGAGELSGIQLDEVLQRLAAGISTSAGQESISVSFSCLATDLDRVMQLFSDVVLRPKFEEARLNLWRSQSLESIRRRTDDPWTVAGIGFQQLIFGNSAYGAVTTSKDVRAITRSALIDLHKRSVTPAGSFMAVSGAVNKQRLLELISRNFGAWETKNPDTGALSAATIRDTKLPPLNFEPKPGIYFVELPLTQASVIIGHQGVARLTPDFPAIDIFNQIFGSGFFGSRLMKSVRTDRGLVYGIFGGVGAGPIRGKSNIAFQTKTESVNEAIEASIGELLKLRSNPVPSTELRETQAAASNAFVFKFDSVEEIAQRAVNLEFLEYPDDYDQTYLSKIASVSPEQIAEVANSRWDLDKLVVLVVGNKDIWPKLPELNQFGPLARLPIMKLTFNEALR